MMLVRLTARGEQSKVLQAVLTCSLPALEHTHLLLADLAFVLGLVQDFRGIHTRIGVAVDAIEDARYATGHEDIGPEEIEAECQGGHDKRGPVQA